MSPVDIKMLARDGTDRTMCRAPWTSLHLDPEGWVTSCNANRHGPLGNVAHRSLLDIWNGEALGRFRSQFHGSQLAPGCDLCAWQRDTAGCEAMYARIYDHLPMSQVPTWPVHIEFTLSIDCNLQCAMCDGSHSSAIRRRREGLDPLRSPYEDEFFEQLPPFLDELHSAKFLGGEPFLSRENLRVWQLMAASPNRPSCHVTTNGTVFTRRIAEVLDAVPMSFAVSMDGITAATVERIRAGAQLRDILANLDRFQAHVERFDTDLSLTFCLMTENWFELADFLVFADDRGLPVFVNTVLSPARFSLYHLPPSRLAEVIARLETETERMDASLGRNLAVWHDQLARLRGAANDPIHPARSPVHLPTLVPMPEMPEKRARTVTEAEETLADWAGAPAIGRLTVDVDGTIRSVDAADVEGVHLDRLDGLGIDELLVWLQSAFGRIDGSAYLTRTPTSGDRVMRFDRERRRTEVRMMSGADVDSGAWWRIAIRRAEPEPRVEARPTT